MCHVWMKLKNDEFKIFIKKKNEIIILHKSSKNPNT